MKKWIFMIVAFALVFVSFQVVNRKLFVKPQQWPKPIYDFLKNPLTQEKVNLGRSLFYEPLLSRNNSISCSSCHSNFTAFTHVDHSLSHGINDRIGFRNAPALMNLAWHSTFMWDGAINHLDMQSLAPISNPDEMDEGIEHVIMKLQQSKVYTKLYFKAFGDSIVTGERTLKALSQFMLTLVSTNSKYDQVMRKVTEFTNQEKEGYFLFKKNCVSCHSEPLFTNLTFENNGLQIDSILKDYGRMRIIQNPQDSIKFKVPSLRNIEFTYPYMHDGRFKTLWEVLGHYTSNVQRGPTLSEKLKKKIILSPKQKVELIAFLLTLTDKEFLYNPNYSFPKEIGN